MASRIKPRPDQDAPDAPAEPARQPAEMHVATISVDQIDGDRNIRHRLGDLTDLADSIRDVGVVQPIAVTPTSTDRYEVVFGHRRLAAAREAGLSAVPAIVRAPLEDGERIVTMIVENIHRLDLSPLEEACAYEALREQGLTQRDMVSRVGRSQAHISKRLSLLRLTEAARSALDSGGIALDEALVLTRLTDHPLLLDEALSARAANSYITMTSHVEQRLRRVEVDQAREAALATLAGQKVPVVEWGDWYRTAEKMIGQGYNHLDVDPEAHAAEPCHAATIDHAGTVHAVCTSPSRHLDTPREQHGATSPPALTSVPDLMDEDEGEKASTGDGAAAPSPAAISEQIPDIGTSTLKVAPPPPPSPEEEQNRVRREEERAAHQLRRAEAEQAQSSRKETMRTLLRGKVARGRSVDFVLRQLLTASLQEYGELGACDLLGLKPTNGQGWTDEGEPFAVETYADGSADKLLRAALAAALTLFDPSPHVDLADATSPATRRHYRYLLDNGYEATPPEALALSAVPEQPRDADGESLQDGADPAA